MADEPKVPGADDEPGEQGNPEPEEHHGFTVVPFPRDRTGRRPRGGGPARPGADLVDA
jgi:hypothetical protein